MLGTPSPRKLFFWLKLGERVGVKTRERRGGGGKGKIKNKTKQNTIFTPLTASILSSSPSRSKACLRVLPALAFRMGIHRQRLTVGHLAPLQSLHKRRTEMRALAALRRGSEARSRRNTPAPPLLSPLLPARPSLSSITRNDVSTRSFQIQHVHGPRFIQIHSFFFKKRIILHIYKAETILWLVTVHTYFSLIFLQHLPRDQEQKETNKKQSEMIS